MATVSYFHFTGRFRPSHGIDRWIAVKHSHQSYGVQDVAVNEAKIDNTVPSKRVTLKGQDGIFLLFGVSKFYVTWQPKAILKPTRVVNVAVSNVPANGNNLLAVRNLAGEVVDFPDLAM